MDCTLSIYTDYLLGSTGQVSATGLSRLYDGAMSHDQVTRFLTTSYLDSKDLWKQAKPLIRQAEAGRRQEDFAVLIADDSIVEKPHTDENAMICYHYDHSQGRMVKGLNFLTLLYEAAGISLPIAVQLIEKTDPETDPKTGKVRYKSTLTKNEYLRAMLKTAQRQVAYRYVLADTWYASAENMQAVLALKHHFIFALECSRTVALSPRARSEGHFERLDAVVFPDKKPLKVYLRSLKEPVWVVQQVFTNKDGRQGYLYLVTSDQHLGYEQITTIYQRRWKVEEYHKSLKQNASMGKSPTKTIGTQANHFFAAILAYIKLEALKIKHCIGQFAIKATRYLAGLKAMQNQLRLMSA